MIRYPRKPPDHRPHLPPARIPASISDCQPWLLFVRAEWITRQLPRVVVHWGICTVLHKEKWLALYGKCGLLPMCEKACSENTTPYQEQCPGVKRQPHFCDWPVAPYANDVKVNIWQHRSKWYLGATCWGRAQLLSLNSLLHGPYVPHHCLCTCGHMHACVWKCLGVCKAVINSFPLP